MASQSMASGQFSISPQLLYATLQGCASGSQRTCIALKKDCKCAGVADTLDTADEVGNGWTRTPLVG